MQNHFWKKYTKIELKRLVDVIPPARRYKMTPDEFKYR